MGLFLSVIFSFARGEIKPSANAEILQAPMLSVSLGQFLTINEFFKLSRGSKKFFGALSKASILKHLADRMAAFATRFTPTFADLLDLEFRLRCGRLEPVLQLFDQKITHG